MGRSGRHLLWWSGRKYDLSLMRLHEKKGQAKIWSPTPFFVFGCLFWQVRGWHTFCDFNSEGEWIPVVLPKSWHHRCLQALQSPKKFDFAYSRQDYDINAWKTVIYASWNKIFTMPPARFADIVLSSAWHFGTFAVLLTP
jgi:hypothetical protein